MTAKPALRIESTVSPGAGMGYICRSSMQARPTPPSVFEYLDYRRYLADYFTARRISDANFSLRAFALKAGLPLSNSSFFSKVIAGKRNLTLERVMIEALRLERLLADRELYVRRRGSVRKLEAV